jgi:hypothetical protein
MVHRAPTESNSDDEPSIGETALTRDEAWNLANDWVAAWNAHDLDRIMAHYDDAVELTSPVAAQLLGTADGKVVGKASLRAYFQRGLAAYPELHFRLADVLWGINSVVLYYTTKRELTRQSSWSCRRAGSWQESWRTTACRKTSKTQSSA